MRILQGTHWIDPECGPPKSIAWPLNSQRHGEKELRQLLRGKGHSKSRKIQTQTRAAHREGLESGKSQRSNILEKLNAITESLQNDIRKLFFNLILIT